jgi:hypothetical protein
MYIARVKPTEMKNQEYKNSVEVTELKRRPCSTKKYEYNSE